MLFITESKTSSVVTYLLMTKASFHPRASFHIREMTNLTWSLVIYKYYLNTTQVLSQSNTHACSPSQITVLLIFIKCSSITKQLFPQKKRTSSRPQNGDILIPVWDDPWILTFQSVFHECDCQNRALRNCLSYAPSPVGGSFYSRAVFTSRPGWSVSSTFRCPTPFSGPPGKW